MADLIEIPSSARRGSGPATPSGQGQGYAGRAPVGEPLLPENDAGLADLLNVVYRRKWMIFAVVLVSVLLTGIILQQLTPRYSAETLLLIETRQTTIPNLDSVLTGLSGDDQGVRSEAEVLRSRGLAARYISGYLLTQPPPGQPRLIGADASHAWVSPERRAL